MSPTAGASPSRLLRRACYAATGFDPIGAIRAAGEAYDLGISNARPYAFWLFGSPVAFAVALGLPDRLVRGPRARHRRRGRDRRSRRSSSSRS